MNCKRCGHELNSNQRFCDNCGAEQGVAAPSPNQPNALPKRKAPEEYHFQLGKGAMGIINLVLGIIGILVTLLFLPLIGLIFLPIFLVGEVGIGEMVCSGIFLIGIFLFLIILSVVNIMMSYGSIIFNGRQIVVKRIGRTRTYDCSEIVEIKWVKRSAYFGLIPVYYIEWRMRDGKKYRRSSAGANFQQVASYFLTMTDAGITSKEAINQYSREMLSECENGTLNASVQ